MRRAWITRLVVATALLLLAAAALFAWLRS